MSAAPDCGRCGVYRSICPACRGCADCCVGDARCITRDGQLYERGRVRFQAAHFAPAITCPHCAAAFQGLGWIAIPLTALGAPIGAFVGCLQHREAAIAAAQARVALASAAT